MTWPIRLRRFLLMPFNCKWNAWVRDLTAKMELGLASQWCDRQIVVRVNNKTLFRESIKCIHDINQIHGSTDFLEYWPAPDVKVQMFLE